MLVILWVFIFLSNPNPILSQLYQEFIYNGFKNSGHNISLGGTAEIDKNGILKLTNETAHIIGHAFYPNPIQFKKTTKNDEAFSFSTAFAFAIIPQYKTHGGHGLVFTISSTKDLKGLPNNYMGLLNYNTDKSHFFAVEFDTVQDLEFQDINDNHVGIDLNSLKSNASVAAAAYFVNNGGNSSKQPLYLQSGKTIQAWIDYNSKENQLNVTLSLSSSKPTSSILSFPVDLSPFLNDSMYVGFSSSTGLLASSHYIVGWSFKMNGQAQSLNLSSLPSLPRPKKNQKALIAGVSVASVTLILLSIGIAVYLITKTYKTEVIQDWELHVGPHRFSYKELKQATSGFRDKEVLGFGGFGRVYRGTLSNSKTQIAVKRISHESKQGLREFVSEISSIGRLRHRNLVQLIGWCRKRGDLLLVYDFMPNGSLDKYIYENPKMILSWEQRFKIIRGVASGLLYLHEEWEQTVIHRLALFIKKLCISHCSVSFVLSTSLISYAFILYVIVSAVVLKIFLIHRDIKAGNVLLDSELNGRLGDFGLAKLYEHGSNPGTTKVVGTLGYIAPELTRTGKPTTSSDVFAFGALMLEVVCGRRPVEQKALPEELILVDWVWDKFKERNVLEVVDKRLRGEYEEGEVMVVVKLGLMCSDNVAAERPSMRQVVRYLDGEVGLPELYERKKSGGGEVEDFLHSYPSSSYFEKVSEWSIVSDDVEADVDGGGGESVSARGKR
ncbi:hypothetical protein LguiA_023707 [Lonicera macranthoides]